LAGYLFFVGWVPRRAVPWLRFVALPTFIDSNMRAFMPSSFFTVYPCNMFYFDQLGELGRLSASMKKLEKELKNKNKYDVCCPCTCPNSSNFLFFVLLLDRDCVTFLSI